MANTVTELMMRRMMGARGSSIDWESIARGMIDQTTEFDVPDGLLDASLMGHYYVFYIREGLKSVTIPAGATQIGAGFFYGCSSLTNIIIPNSVIQVQASAFAGCTNLASVTLNEGLTTFGQGVFQGCTSLTSITIPSTVTNVNVNFMRQCTALQEVVMLPSAPPTMGVNGFLQCANLASIYVPDASVSAYQSANNWSSHSSKIKPISQRPT